MGNHGHESPGGAVSQEGAFAVVCLAAKAASCLKLKCRHGLCLICSFKLPKKGAMTSISRLIAQNRPPVRGAIGVWHELCSFQLAQRRHSGRTPGLSGLCGTWGAVGRSGSQTKFYSFQGPLFRKHHQKPWGNSWFSYYSCSQKGFRSSAYSPLSLCCWDSRSSGCILPSSMRCRLDRPMCCFNRTLPWHTQIRGTAAPNQGAYAPLFCWVKEKDRGNCKLGSASVVRVELFLPFAWPRFLRDPSADQLEGLPFRTFGKDPSVWTPPRHPLAGTNAPMHPLRRDSNIPTSAPKCEGGS